MDFNTFLKIRLFQTVFQGDVFDKFSIKLIFLSSLSDDKGFWIHSDIYRVAKSNQDKLIKYILNKFVPDLN